jgi:hypothetical protein
LRFLEGVPFTFELFLFRVCSNLKPTLDRFGFGNESYQHILEDSYQLQNQ